MTLSGAQHQQLQAALLASFDDTGLRLLVRQELDVELETIAGGRNRTEIVLNLIAWAERSDHIGELIDGAVRQNPNSPDLLLLREGAAAWHVAAPASADLSPYKGLEQYDVDDAHLFFGREVLTAELVAYLKNHQFLAIVGASGSGKSSVVRAGVIAALHEGRLIKGSAAWPILLVVPGSHPLKALAAALTQTSESVTAQATAMDDLRKDSRSLDLYAARLVAPGGGQRLVLVVDQFEEIFTLCQDKDERNAFVANLLTAADAGDALTLVLTLRADFYAQCAQFERLRRALQDSQRYIGPMSADELTAVIERPAAAGGWELEPGLTTRLLKEVLDQPGSLPLLSHALLETWKRRSGRTLTLAGYEASGGVQGAIAHTADALYTELAPAQQVMVRHVFMRLTSLGEGAQDTRRRVELDELTSGAQPAEMQALLTQLQDARLVTAERDVQGGVYVDVVHEAIIREWPLLRRWLDEDRDGLRVHRRLTDAAVEWEALERDPGALLRGALLTQAAEWAAAHPVALNDRERTFLEASQAAQAAAAEMQARLEREREAAQQRALADAQALAAEQQKRAEGKAAAAHRLQQRNRYLLAALGATVALALLAGIFFVQAQLSAADARAQSQVAQANAAAAAQAQATAVANGAQAERNAAEAELQRAAAAANAAEAERQRAAAQANADLANARLRDLEGERLLQEARQFKADLKATAAISAYQAAYAVEPTLLVLSDERRETLRYVATQYVQEGERILCRANFATPDNCGGPPTELPVGAEAAPISIAPEYLAWAARHAPEVVGWPDTAPEAQQQAVISATALFSQALALNPPPDTPVYVWIGPGAFVMGSTDAQCEAAGCDDDEQPSHRVDLGGYWIGRTEVTNAQYVRCVEAGACPEPPRGSLWRQPSLAQHPVTYLDWNQAVAYAAWAGGRLPTEAEWEYACRTTDGRTWPWGREPPSPELLNHGMSVGGVTAAGTYPPTGRGLYDMAGNVLELTGDLYDEDYYAVATRRNQAGPDQGASWVIRGGAWNGGDDEVRCAFRNDVVAGYRSSHVGFRVVLPGKTLRVAP